MNDNSLISYEQSVRGQMLRHVAKKFGLDAGLADQKIENLLLNLPMAIEAVKTTGYVYGVPPHRMGEEIREKLRFVGQVFAEGFEVNQDPGKILDMGMDVFKCLVIDLSSDDLREWDEYLTQELWRSTGKERRR